jgi:mannose-6-phosphate isomerase-like protein (cupin superfamily)
MKRRTIFVVTGVLLLSPALGADDGYKVATVISSGVLEHAKAIAPPDSVSDQPLSHVESAAGRLGIGVVHRPVIKAGGAIDAIRHHKQSEVYRVMSGSGTLVTSAKMTEASPIDPDGFIVQNLVGPSDLGVITEFTHSQLIGEGDVIIIPAGVAHGFSEITDPITYMVVRIDPEGLVALK